MAQHATYNLGCEVAIWSRANLTKYFIPFNTGSGALRSGATGPLCESGPTLREPKKKHKKKNGKHGFGIGYNETKYVVHAIMENKDWYSYDDFHKAS